MMNEYEYQSFLILMGQCKKHENALNDSIKNMSSNHNYHDFRNAIGAEADAGRSIMTAISFMEQAAINFKHAQLYLHEASI